MFVKCKDDFSIYSLHPANPHLVEKIKQDMKIKKVFGDITICTYTPYSSDAKEKPGSPLPTVSHFGLLTRWIFGKEAHRHNKSNF